jgi:flavin-dependent dehydrogenase
MLSNSSNRFDVLIVGARCAGSPLATFLKRGGLSVCIVRHRARPRYFRL